MLKIKRLAPALAILALAACTDMVGPTDPVLTAAAEGEEQEDQAQEDRAGARGGSALEQ